MCHWNTSLSSVVSLLLSVAPHACSVSDKARRYVCPRCLSPSWCYNFWTILVVTCWCSVTASHLTTSHLLDFEASPPFHPYPTKPCRLHTTQSSSSRQKADLECALGVRTKSGGHRVLQASHFATRTGDATQHECSLNGILSPTSAHGPLHPFSLSG